jgi:hypothetical protein
MPQKEKIRIRISDIVHDIRTGVAEYDLMSKYGLSSRGLQSAFRKLIAANAVSYEEICGRSPDYEDTCEVVESRLLERNYVIFELPVLDVNDVRNSGWIRDLTEKGLKVSGLRAYQGEVMKLLIVPDGLEDFEPLSLEARCRWVSHEGSGAKTLAGFQIANISADTRDQLNRLIELITITL